MREPRPRWLPAAVLAFLAIAPALRAAAQPDPAVFDAVLAARARGGGFDYRGATGQDRKRLAAYLANLGDARPQDLGDGEREAFWLNAYNATAIAIVLEHYPIASIRDVDGVFASVRRRIGGEMRTLDEIENRLREAGDSRIHFAIVCASRSCPPLSARAYRSATLSADLDAQGRAFLADSAKNRIDPAGRRLALSQIFEWNRREFERDGGTLKGFVARFVAEPAQAEWLKTAAPTPEFLPYDWALNQP